MCAYSNCSRRTCSARTDIVLQKLAEKRSPIQIETPPELLDFRDWREGNENNEPERLDIEREKSAEYKLKIVRNAQICNKMHQVFVAYPCLLYVTPC